MVVAQLKETAQRQDDDERRHAEGDDDGGQYQGLRQRIGVGLQIEQQDRRRVDAQPPHGEQQQIDGIGEQGQAEDHREGAAAQK